MDISLGEATIHPTMRYLWHFPGARSGPKSSTGAGILAGACKVPALFLPCLCPLPCDQPHLGQFQQRMCVSPGPSRPTSLHCVHRFAGHRFRPRKEKADFWAKLHTSKEAKNLPAARVGSAARCNAHHPGNRGHHLPGALLLPPAWREQ